MSSLDAGQPALSASRKGRSRSPVALSPDFVATAELFAVLANPTRVQLMGVLDQQEHDVTSLADLTGVSMSTVSHHLARLRQANLVSSRWVGRNHLYRAGDRPRVDALVLRSMIVDS